MALVSTCVSSLESVACHRNYPDLLNQPSIQIISVFCWFVQEWRTWNQRNDPRWIYVLMHLDPAQMQGWEVHHFSAWFLWHHPPWWFRFVEIDGLIHEVSGNLALDLGCNNNGYWWVLWTKRFGTVRTWDTEILRWQWDEMTDPGDTSDIQVTLWPIGLKRSGHVSCVAAFALAFVADRGWYVMSCRIAEACHHLPFGIGSWLLLQTIFGSFPKTCQSKFYAVYHDSLSDDHARSCALCMNSVIQWGFSFPLLPHKQSTISNLYKAPWGLSQVTKSQYL